MSNSAVSIHNPVVSAVRNKDDDYVFYELTRSICPNCKKVIDAKILLRDNKVFMAKRCPDCGPFEALVYGDAEAYTSFSKFNKPGTIHFPTDLKSKRGAHMTAASVRTISSTPASALSRSTAPATWIAR